MYFITRLLSWVAVLTCAATVYSQIPRVISYQGVLTDASGTLVADGNYTLVISLYDAPTGGSPLYTETHAAAVVKGIFNAIIGTSTPLAPSLLFDRAYFLGVTVNGGTELAPRTPFAAAPYALNAIHAVRSDTAMFALSGGGGGGGGVTTVNTIDGAVTIVGGGGTTVNNDVAGHTITVSSSGGGGNGIQGVQNTDGKLSITNPNGPTATINVTNNSLDANKLSIDVGSLLKVSGGVFQATPTDVSIFGDLKFMSDDLSIIFPPVSGVSDPMIFMFASGTQNADRMIVAHSPDYPTWGMQYRDSTDELHFLRAGASVMNVDLGASRVGIGGIPNPVATLDIQGEGSTDVFSAHTAGTGKAGVFQISNASSGARALDVSTNGTGSAVMATSAGGMGVWGITSSPSAAAVIGDNLHGEAVVGRSRIADGGSVVGRNDSSGQGVRGFCTQTGIGVLGQHSATSGLAAGTRGETNSTSSGSSIADGASGTYGIVNPTSPGGYSAGVRGINNGTSNNGIGVAGYQAGSGWGVAGESASGYAIYSAGNAFKTTGGNTWSIPSDSRLKHDIRPFTDGLSVLEQITPKRYYYNGTLNTKTTDEEIGIIAEDMQRVAPYTVKPYAHPKPDGSTMEILTYNSGALTYVTINAVKELAAEVQQLRQELDAAITLLRANGLDPEGKLSPVTGK